MGLLQPDVGHRGGDGEPRLTPRGKSITIYELGHAQAALAAAASLGVPVVLASAEAAAAAAGPAWFQSLVEQAMEGAGEVEVTAILDCGDQPGHALAALRQGLKTIRYDGENVFEIADIAEQSGAEIVTERPQSLDLREIEAKRLNLQTACLMWLESEPG